MLAIYSLTEPRTTVHECYEYIYMKLYISVNESATDFINHLNEKFCI